MRSLSSSKEPADRFIIEALDELRALRQDRLRRDEQARRAHEDSEASGEFAHAPRAPNPAPIAGAKVSSTGRPSTMDFDAGLFASTNESEAADASAAT
jgi:hypothetical protein